MKKIAIMFVSLLLVSLSTASYAIPTLFFNGTVTYTAGSGLLSVDAELVDTTDLSLVPVLVGSSLSFSSLLQSSSSTAVTTTGNFADTSDLSVFGGDTTFLLGGEIANLTMLGVNGLDFGAMDGNVTPTGGDLAINGDFTAPSQLLAIELNMSTVFAPDMFQNDFTAQIDGQITSATAVPEPQTLALIGLGLLFVTGCRKFLANNA